MGIKLTVVGERESPSYTNCTFDKKKDKTEGYLVAYLEYKIKIKFTKVGESES